MSLSVDVDSVGVRPALSRARVAALAEQVLRAEKVRHAMLSIAFVDEKASARLNREHLGHRGPTDVITFALGGGAEGTAGGAEGPVIGDIYICPAVVRENARRHGVPGREELARVVVHATLHALGYEHPDDDGRTASPMWQRQERLLRRFLRTAPA